MPVNRKKGSPRYGRRYTIGPGGSHVYRGRGGKKIVVGGKKAPRKPTDPYKPQIDAAVDLEFGDTDLELAKQRRVSGQASLNVASWWDGYKADVERARQVTQEGSRAAQQGVYSQANSARAQDQANSGAMDAEAQRAAALRGTSAGPNVAAAAQASRSSLSNSFGGLVGAQGAAQNAYQANQYRIGGGIRALELGKEAGRGRALDEQGRQIAVKKGAYRSQTRQALVAGEQKAQLEAAAFGLKSQTAALGAADQQADNDRQAARDRQAAADRAAGRRVTRRGQDVTSRGQDLTDQRARDNAAKGPAGAKGKSPFTPTQRRAARKDYEKAVGEVRGANYKGTPIPMLLKKNPKKWRSFAIRKLQSKYGYQTSKKAVDRVIATGRRKKKLTKKDVDRAFAPLRKL